MNHVVSISTGLSSALSFERVLKHYGAENTTGIFMDTTIEDEDNYRFFNDCKTRWSVPILVLTEGRTPYEVAEDQRIIPNQKIAPCTFVLKINLFKDWLEAQEKPITVHIGYDEINDAHRMEATRRNYEALGYSVDFPLTWKPIEYRKYAQVVREDWGIEPPRMYKLGYTHANCGGECVKQGQGDWIRTLINFPDRYARREAWEQKMLKLSDKHAEYAILRDQSNGTVTPLTLKELRERHESQPQDALQLDFNAPCVVCGVGDLLA